MNVRNALVKIAIGLGIAGSLVLLYALAGYYLLPYLIQTQAPGMIKEMTGRSAGIEKVELDPFHFTFALHGFSLQEKDGQTFAAFDRFEAAVEPWRSIRDFQLILSKVEFVKPFVRLARQKSGAFNFSDLSPTSEQDAGKSDGAMLSFTIERLALTDGRVVWEDAQPKKPVKEEIDPINLTLEQVAARKEHSFPLHLTLALKSGGALEWEGEAGIDPLFSKGRIKLDGFTLQNLSTLVLQDVIDFKLQGNALLEAQYQLRLAEDRNLVMDIGTSRFELKDFLYAARVPHGLALKAKAIKHEAGYKITYAGERWRVIADKAQVGMRGLEMTGFGLDRAAVTTPEFTLAAAVTADKWEKKTNVAVRSGQASFLDLQLRDDALEKPLLKVGRLAAEDVTVDLLKRSVTANAVKSENADILAWLTPDGKINYQSLLPPAAQTVKNGRQSEGAVTEMQAEPWAVAIKTIALSGYGIDFEDRTQSKAVAASLRPVNVTLTDFTNHQGASLPIRFDAGFNQEGRIKMDGEIVVEPFTARLAVTMNDIALDKFQTYVDQAARLDVIKGGLFVDGDLGVRLSENQQPDVTFQGTAGIADLLTRDQIRNRDFIKWHRLTLSGIEADVSANRYTAKRLLINRPYARVMIRKDKSVNVTEILSAGQSNPSAAPRAGKKTEPEAKPVFFKLDKIEIQQGSSDFADRSLILPFAAEIKELDGGATGVSSEKGSNIQALLNGNAYDLAPVVVRGDIKPFRGEFDVELSFIGLPMPLVSPYMVQFAGYKVEKGKLNLDLKYKVEKGKLTASNKILIDQFELGEKVENPNAVSVPLDLAVALLKDSQNKIKLDVPITGSLEDPKFSLRAIITDALLNTLSKVVTSPFNAIASLLGSEEELDQIVFSPGSEELEAGQMTKLKGLAKALKERPQLNLEIKGAAYEDQDWTILRQAALDDQLKKMKADAIAKKGGKRVPAEYIELSDKENKELLAQLFIEKFPLLADRSLFGTPRLTDREAGDFYEVARQKLTAAIKPEERRLKNLASKRAQAIARFLVQQGGISHERIFILDAAVNPKRHHDKNEVVSFLSLKAH